MALKRTRGAFNSSKNEGKNRFAPENSLWEVRTFRATQFFQQPSSERNASRCAHSVHAHVRRPGRPARLPVKQNVLCAQQQRNLREISESRSCLRREVWPEDEQRAAIITRNVLAMIHAG